MVLQQVSFVEGLSQRVPYRRFHCSRLVRVLYQLSSDYSGTSDKGPSEIVATSLQMQRVIITTEGKGETLVIESPDYLATRQSGQREEGVRRWEVYVHKGNRIFVTLYSRELRRCGRNLTQSGFLITMLRTDGGLHKQRHTP